MAVAPSRTSAAGHRAGFWIVGVTFLFTMAFSTVPTPLYPLYQRRDGFSTFTVTVIFATYAVGVILSLVLVGHVSDWVGRRRMVLATLVTELVSALLFLVWDSLPGLLVARLICGIGVGMLTATATAHLQELDSLARPGAGPARFELISTAVNLGGLGLGPLIAGALAEYVAGPLRTPYLLFVVLLALCFAAMLLVPETVSTPAERVRYRPQRISLRYGDSRAFLAAGLGGFSALSVFGMFGAVSPEFVAGTLHHSSRLLAGAIVFLVFAASVMTQMLSGRLPAGSPVVIGLVLGALGLVLIVIGIRASSLAPFLAGGIVAGAGGGLLFKAGVGAVAGMAPPAERGEALAGFFFIAYLGLILPIVGIGVAQRYVAGSTALYGFAALLLVLQVVIGVATVPRRTRPGER